MEILFRCNLGKLSFSIEVKKLGCETFKAGYLDAVYFSLTCSLGS